MTDTNSDQMRDDLVVLNREEDTAAVSEEDLNAINALRFLIADGVEKANSGHPGTGMALAPLAYRLYTRHMVHDPSNPDWFHRDRLVLSVGHASMMLYGSLHLTGYDLTLDDIASFRQADSLTPGHPEREVTPGIDMSTGPLGQGVANGAGFALAEKMLAGQFNRPGHNVIDHRSWVIAGDGDMMEGISSEAASLAGRLSLDKLTVFYDDNRISLEGARDREFCEDVPERFDAYGWHVERVSSVNDLDALDAAIEAAKAETERPSLIIVGSTIGYGTPKAGSADAHGTPLGAEAIKAARETLNWPHEPFEIPDAVYDSWRSGIEAKHIEDHVALLDSYAKDHPELSAELTRRKLGKLPDGWADGVTPFPAGGRMSGRKAASRTLNEIAAAVPELVGGAADVTPSTLTEIDDGGDVNSGDWAGRNIHFGVREHAMGAMCNAIAAHGGLRPYCATYFVFSDYLRPTVRMAALMEVPVIFVMTHDSIGVGQDGPTHQPIEHLASFRAMPGVQVIRAGDANEASIAWQTALAHSGPSVLVFSRQDMAILDPGLIDPASGPAIVAEGNDLTIVATGTEVEVALAARDQLGTESVSARVVSLPSWEIFRGLTAEQRESIIPRSRPSMSFEAGSTQGWQEFVDEAIGIDHFGASAPPAVLFEKFGLTADALAARALAIVRSQ